MFAPIGAEDSVDDGAAKYGYRFAQLVGVFGVWTAVSDGTAPLGANR